MHVKHKSFEFLSEGEQCSWGLNVFWETVPHARSGMLKARSPRRSRVQGTAKLLFNSHTCMSGG